MKEKQFGDREKFLPIGVQKQRKPLFKENHRYIFKIEASWPLYLFFLILIVWMKVFCLKYVSLMLCAKSSAKRLTRNQFDERKKIR